MATTVSTYSLELASLLHRQPHQFLQPALQHQQAAVASAKSILDPLADRVSQSQLARRSENRKKRKRGADDGNESVLQLRHIYTDGLAIKQIWEQARRILDAAYDEVERNAQGYHNTQQQLASDRSLSEEEDDDDELQINEDSLDEADFFQDGDSGDDQGVELVNGHLDDNDDEELENDSAEDTEVGSNLAFDQAQDEDEPQTTYQEDPNKLNDGFFSIDDFNKQSQFLEQMDARGDDDNPSDEDGIDWEADPFTSALPTNSSAMKPSRHRGESETADSEEDGPTFGNADLNVMEDDDNDEDDPEVEAGDLDDMMAGLVNTNDIRYANFFEPPPKKPSKTKRMRALPKTQPPSQTARAMENIEEEEAADLERAMADVRRDLFDSDEDVEEEIDSDNDSDASGQDDDDTLPRLPASKIRDKNLSTHEKQRLQIAEEIRRLEAINVSKKPWTLSGEATAAARPINSLIEEDLDFERTGKPVPVITAEVTTDIEALIKRRILARDFDEVVRRRPTTLDSATDARRGRADVVVDDAKATAGLGEIYESDYQRNADPAAYVDKRSAAAKKQHEQISKLWKEVRDQLDVLSNLNVKPKRTEAEIKTIEDKPRIAMEDAQPAIAGGIDESGTMLAPQDIYKPGTDSRAHNGQVLNAKSGATHNKEEMSREEKIRKRRRDKERQKKSGHTQTPTATNSNQRVGKKAQQDQILKDLQKGGAKVIGKDGQLQNIDPKKSRKNEVQSAVSGSALKL